MAPEIEITGRTPGVLKQLRNLSERRDWQRCKQDTRKGQEIVTKVRAATRGLENIPITSAFCMV